MRSIMVECHPIAGWPRRENESWRGSDSDRHLSSSFLGTELSEIRYKGAHSENEGQRRQKESQDKEKNGIANLGNGLSVYYEIGQKNERESEQNGKEKTREPQSLGTNVQGSVDNGQSDKLQP
ncbi:MAG: hypothetical protein H8E40_11340 [Chloroflexi bacterium]|nr:hypothetical protein [Chloroflexota bacterium]